jgi:uncharacterized repeat protein (TIGR03803 family)
MAFKAPFVLLLCCLVGLFLNSAVGQTSETTLHSFTGSPDGADPVADLLYDSGSNTVYGTTNKGGASHACAGGCGTVFSIKPDGSAYTILYSFAGGITDGANPQAGLVRDSSGSLYGTTYNGGAHKLGTIFKLSPIGGGLYSETVLFSFDGKNGAHPLARLVFDDSDNIYGTTYEGGTTGDGVVFELPATGTETVLYSFTGPDGSRPRAGVVFDASHNLWGTTSLGGGSNLGTVFMLSSSSGLSSESFLYSFTGTSGANLGANPYGAITLDSLGNVYGTTKFGGAPCSIPATTGCGVVFELQPSGGGYVGVPIYAFDGGPDGALPVDKLTLTVDGSGFSYLYGTASAGGDTSKGCPKAGCGTAFELCSMGSSCGSSSPWSEYTLFDFTGRTSGRTPEANIINFAPVSGAVDPLTHRRNDLHGGCTSACMTALSGGGASNNGTIDELP